MKKKLIIIILFLISISILFYLGKNEKGYNKDTNYIKKCELINLKNINKIINKDKSGAYLNPFDNEKCFLLSFGNNVNFNHNDIIIDDNGKYSVLYYLNNIDDVLTYHYKQNEYTYDFIKYSRKSSSYKNFEMNMNFIEIYKKYADFIIFYHEIYHLNNFKFNMNEEDKLKEEINADIFALLLILHFNDINKEEFLELIEIVKELRIKSYSVEIKYTRLLENNNFDNLLDDYKNNFKKLNKKVKEIKEIKEILKIKKDLEIER